MAKLIVDQKTIKDLFQDKRSDFLIPDYQRPYAWGETECQTLWDDVLAFAIPDNDYSKFNENDEYFFGPIVTFKNERGKMEVIDGQQRLTTLMLLLRAFYPRFEKMEDNASRSTRENIEKCIWKTDIFGNPDVNALKIDSEVASDKDKGEFIEILKTGIVRDEQKSIYAANYRFFVTKIDEFIQGFACYLPYLATRIMQNCILLPIEAESQDTALRIFSTLNDRGKPLSDSDIFKAQFYKYYTGLGKKDAFIKRWKELEELCEKVFRPANGTPMDELFTRYMYYVRAKMGIKLSTTEALRKFYEKDGYALLKNEATFENLIVLAHFWDDVYNQNVERFSEQTLRNLFVLIYAPNSMWTYLVSVYFMQNKDGNGMLDDTAFSTFLEKITGFIWTYAVTNPGVNALRTPVYAEMVNIVNDMPVTFDRYKFDAEKVRSMFANFSFGNSRQITKSMLMWWAFQKDEQPLLSAETAFEIEHIFARNRQEIEQTLQDARSLECLGNKAILEKKINIRAADYRFEDKKKYYTGFMKNNQKKDGTKIYELVFLANTVDDFTEADIKRREQSIMDAFITFLNEQNLTE